MENNNITDIQNIKFESSNQIFVFLARRYYGKTVLLHNLLVNLIENNEPISKVYLVSDTAHLNQSYRNFVKRGNIFSSDKLDFVISRVFEHQKKKKKSERKQILVIVDDVPLTKISKELGNVCTFGRHYNISACISVQYSKVFLSPIIKNNVDVFFVGELNKKQISELYDSWVSKHEDFNSFYKFYRDNVSKPVFLCYNTREQKRDDRISLVSCDILPEDVKIKHN